MNRTGEERKEWLTKTHNTEAKRVVHVHAQQTKATGKGLAGFIIDPLETAMM